MLYKKLEFYEDICIEYLPRFRRIKIILQAMSIGTFIVRQIGCKLLFKLSLLPFLVYNNNVISCFTVHKDGTYIYTQWSHRFPKMFYLIQCSMFYTTNLIKIKCQIYVWTSEETHIPTTFTWPLAYLNIYHSALCIHSTFVGVDSNVMTPSIAETVMMGQRSRMPWIYLQWL